MVATAQVLQTAHLHPLYRNQQLIVLQLGPWPLQTKSYSSLGHSLPPMQGVCPERAAAVAAMAVVMAVAVTVTVAVTVAVVVEKQTEANLPGVLTAMTTSPRPLVSFRCLSRPICHILLSSHRSATAPALALANRSLRICRMLATLLLHLRGSRLTLQ